MTLTGSSQIFKVPVINIFYDIQYYKYATTIFDVYRGYLNHYFMFTDVYSVNFKVITIL